MSNRQLLIYNSLSRKKERFIPIHKDHVGMYVCGPTVYSNVHLGNCRTFLSFDLIYRFLLHLGYSVRYVRNITDAGHLENDADHGEDKISKKARLEQLEPMEIVQKYTLDFHKVLEQFNALPPSIEPTATGHILEQINMIGDIIEKGFAYEKNESVYFDVEKYNKENNYGILSGRNIEELLSGTRELDNQAEKKSPLDFALWKKASPEHIMRWKSPWGIGFPGWHLECSVMSSKYLGESFDIHGGGMDLQFPHHECEIAQCQAANGIEPVKYWIHGNMLTFNGQRMSKSTGNSILPGELFTGNHALLDQAYSPNTIRFFMLQAHYRSTLDISNEAIKAAEKGLKRLMKSWNILSNVPVADKTTFDLDKWESSCYEAMCDDFNSPILIAHLFDASKYIVQLIEGKSTITKNDHVKFTTIYSNFIFNVLGLQEDEKKETQNDAEFIELLLNIRQEARESKNFSLSDKVRDGLSTLGVLIKDSKEGTTWEYEN